MNTQVQTNSYPSLSITYVLIFCTGVACMAVAGYFLIQGLSEFSGTSTISNMLIIGGILFQITESICFIAASALTYHSLRWRYILFSLGTVLFCFSIGVMTLAQKTALQTGETQAKANDEKRAHLRNQIASLQKVIDSYRFNAERQSKSIYKDSRAKGQDSLNRAALLEEKKMRLSDEVFALNKARRETSSDFFKRVESVLGLPAASTEFYFLVFRSLLLELSAIILMSFAANLRAYNNLVLAAEQKNEGTFNGNSLTQAVTGRNEKDSPATTALVNEKAESEQQQGNVKQVWVSASENQQVIKQTVADQPIRRIRDLQPDANSEEHDADFVEYEDTWEVDSDDDEHRNSTPVFDPKMNDLVNAIVDMYEKNVLKDLSSDAIKEGVSRYLNQSLTHEKAGILSKLVSNRMDQPC